MTDDRGDDQDDVGMAPRGAYAESDRPQCTATAMSGERCRGVVVPGLDVCHRHLGQSDVGADRSEPLGVDEEEEEDRPVWERHPEILRETTRRKKRRN